MARRKYWKFRANKIDGYIETLERELKITATKNFLPMQMGDVPTLADTSLLQTLTDYHPSTSVKDGIRALWIGIGNTMTVENLCGAKIAVSGGKLPLVHILLRKPYGWAWKYST